MVYSTYLGGSGNDGGTGIAADPNGNAYVTGFTSSTDFPTMNAFQPVNAGGTDAFVTKLAGVGAPAKLVLSPAAATNPVGTTHTVTATVTDAAGTPVPNVIVRFTVTGSVSASGMCTTNASGQCSFTYAGPALPGTDVISAFADTNNNGTHDPGEPTGTATKAWVVPGSTPGVEIRITGGGRIRTLTGHKVTFGGNARLTAGQTSGQEEFQDHTQPLNVHSLNVLRIVCADSTHCDIYGQATINGAGSFIYRIRVKDGGTPGKSVDMYGIVLNNGYASGDQPLEDG